MTLPDILLRAALLRMGGSGYQDVIPAPLSEGVRGKVVLAYNSTCRCLGYDLVHIRHVHGDFRMLAGWFVLAAFARTALCRFAKVLLGNGYIESASGRHYSVFAYSHDMETANVG